MELRDHQGKRYNLKLAEDGKQKRAQSGIGLWLGVKRRVKRREKTKLEEKNQRISEFGGKAAAGSEAAYQKKRRKKREIPSRKQPERTRKQAKGERQREEKPA